ncbi:M15 family metallopeptidase [Microbacterium sp. BWT-B31]|uniref:M15 family metallopeptidase n=1 Tax=Microbacterium sp. BWT-B31 TaxID=3232072 RepID=UPI003528496A
MTAPPPHMPTTTRRALREARERASRPAQTTPASHRSAWSELLAAVPSGLPRHARKHTRKRAVVALMTAIGSVLIVASASVVTAAVAVADARAPVVLFAGVDASDPVAAAIQSVVGAAASPTPHPTPSPTGDPQEEPLPPPPRQVPFASCENPAVVAALAAGDDSAVLAAAGGARAFREAVVAGGMPCIGFDDPARVWNVIDKLRPSAPVDYAPAALARATGVQTFGPFDQLRPDAAAAMTALAEASRSAGAGEIAVASAYRDYWSQIDVYGDYVSMHGAAYADLESARPGFSEHQSGLAADVLPCFESCLTMDDVAGSPQGAWLVGHAWEYGWITRYEEGSTPITGYMAEPWHLRYVGVELAAEYHAGGWRSLEEFFGLPAAGDYPAGS